MAYTIMAGMMPRRRHRCWAGRAAGTLPLFLAIGMIAGLAFAVYVAYLRTR